MAATIAACHANLLSHVVLLPRERSRPKATAAGPTKETTATTATTEAKAYPNWSIRPGDRRMIHQTRPASAGRVVQKIAPTSTSLIERQASERQIRRPAGRSVTAQE